MKSIVHLLAAVLLAMYPWIPFANAIEHSALRETRFFQQEFEANRYKKSAEIIEHAQKTPVLDERAFAFLSEPDHAAGLKIALINANFLSQPLAPPGEYASANAYRAYLERKYQTAIAITRTVSRRGTVIGDILTRNLTLAPAPSFLNDGELLALGYLEALNHATMPTSSLELLFGALARMPQSLATRVVLAITLASIVVHESDFAEELEQLGPSGLANLPDAERERLLSKQSHMSRTERKAYIYRLFEPMMRARSTGNYDLSIGALREAVSFADPYIDDYTAWLREEEEFQAPWRALGLKNCEGLLERPAPYTVTD